MASENAKAVAQEVLDKVRKGKKIHLGQIIEKRYSKAVSLCPTKVTKTASYKSVVDPFLEKLKKARDQAIDRLTSTIDEAKYRDLSDAIDKFTKNIELLSGRETERVGGLQIYVPRKEELETESGESRESSG